MRLLVVALLIGGLSPAQHASASATQTCGNASGGIDETGLRVEASTASCGSPQIDSSGYAVLRTTRSDPLVCAGTPDAMQETITWFLPGSLVPIGRVTRCLGAVVTDPVLPPAPPSALELFREASLPLPEVQVNPRVRGLVGLETWLWWGADTDVAPLRVTAGEWSASIEVDAVSMSWDLGNGDVVTASEPGRGPRRPSITYVYESQCECTITLVVAWSGTVTLTHPLSPVPIVQPVGPVTFTDTFAYEVDEREAVIIG